MVAKDYWWPDMKKFVQNYVKGCATCQMTKPNTVQPRVPLLPIAVVPKAIPFQTISLDLITDLPVSKGYNSILTIIDYDCWKAAVFLPCQKTIDAEGIAQLYVQHVFPHFGHPQHVISDRDPRFTAQFTRQMCTLLGITQNISTAYHPQTDGQSERTNQWVEQYLRIYGNGQQDNWANLLPLAQFVHNSWPNASTKRTPFELLFSVNPIIHITGRTTNVPELNKRQEWLKGAREHAQEAIKKVQEMWLKLHQRKKGQRQFRLFEKGEQVWLEGTNLKLSHPSTKLAPRRYGPFPITDVISPVVYRIQLPPHWRIHNVFHVSLLTPYKETGAHGRNFPEPPPDLIEGEPEYEVDQILAVRRHGRNQDLQHLLCWKGYSQAHNSWEPAENVTAPELIKEFYEHNPNAEGGGRIKKKQKRQKIRTITSTPMPLTTMSNALQISLEYPYSKEEYSSILEATFTMEALAIGGQWSLSGTSSAKDSLE
jgi:Chromo (CHRromatin Organisation MOdifier) domain/Integrase zinc binding domain